MDNYAIQRLNALIKEKNSRICAGLNLSWDNIPISLKKEYNCELLSFENVENGIEVVEKYSEMYINAISDIVPAIQINISFFEQYGLNDLYFKIANIAKTAGLFVIGDIKKGDTDFSGYSNVFLTMKSPFDAITINPYFGEDGVLPFLRFARKSKKAIFIVVKTTNKTANEIQYLELKDGTKLYETIADLTVKWWEEWIFMDNVIGESEGYPLIGAIVGALNLDEMKGLKQRLPGIFKIYPEYGVKGITANDLAVNFDSEGLGAIINSPKEIINAYKKDIWKKEYSEKTWDKAAKKEAIRETKEINEAINKYLGKEIC